MKLTDEAIRKWIELASLGHDTARDKVEQVTCKTGIAIAEELLSLREKERWIPVSERLPKTMVPVIAYYKNSYGKDRRIRAQYVPKHTIDMEDYPYDGDGDYVEAKDTSYWPEGWYEDNEHEETHWYVDETVTHWKPLPEAPQEGS